MSAWTMTANKSDGKNGSVKAPAGNHVAVLVGIFDMGHQWQDGYQGAPGKYQHRGLFVWELINEQIAGTNKNHVIAIDLTLSLNEKAKLRKWIEARTGKVIPDGSQFDPVTELGQPCMLNVVMKGDYPRVEGIAAVPKGVPVPKPGYEPTAVLLSEFMDGTPIPEWCPWLYGNPLTDHINACEEIGGDKPKPRKKSEPTADGAPGDAPPGDGDASDGPDPNARWDFHNGKAWEKDKPTKDVESHITFNKLSAEDVWVKPAGVDVKQAKKASEFKFADGSPIPY